MLEQYGIILLCLHETKVLGAALEPTIAALQAVARTDQNVIAVGFAMAALVRLVNMRADDEPQPQLADLQTRVRDLLGESPIQCWEALARAGVMP